MIAYPSFVLSAPPVWAICLAAAGVMMAFARRWSGGRAFLAVVLIQLGLFGLMTHATGRDQARPSPPAPAREIRGYFPVWIPPSAVEIPIGRQGPQAVAGSGSIAPPAEQPPDTPMPSPPLETGTAPPALADGDAPPPLGGTGADSPLEAISGPPPQAAAGAGTSGAQLNELLPPQVGVVSSDWFGPIVLTADPVVWVFVIDCSGSMGTTDRLRKVLNEVQRISKLLPKGSRFQVLWFADKDRFREGFGCLGSSAKPQLLPVSEDSLKQAFGELARVTPDGGTDPMSALQQALALGPDDICFLADGNDFVFNDVHEKALLDANRRQTRIHGTLVGEAAAEPSQNYVRRITAKHHGEFHYKGETRDVHAQATHDDGPPGGADLDRHPE